jgi:hypothetical protein
MSSLTAVFSLFAMLGNTPYVCDETELPTTAVFASEIPQVFGRFPSEVA